MHRPRNRINERRRPFRGTKRDGRSREERLGASGDIKLDHVRFHDNVAGAFDGFDAGEVLS